MKSRFYFGIKCAGGIFAVALLMYLFFGMGRSTPHPTINSDIDLAALNSPSFKSLKNHVDRPALLFDREDGTCIIFEIGENLPDRFLRMGTIRVDKKTMKVSRLSEDKNGEYLWLDE